MMKRRAFLQAALLAGAWPRTGLSQRLYRIGTLVNGTEETWGGRINALRAGLQAVAYVEGRNFVLISRWNEGSKLERLPDIAAGLLREKPDIVVCAPTLAAAAVHQHTRTLPIVQASGAGALKIGLAKTLARPGGNVTGIETQIEELTPKHIELLRTIAPRVSRVAVLNTGRYLFHDEAWQAALQTARALKVELLDVRVSTPADLARLTSVCAKGGCDGLYVLPDPVLLNWRALIIESARSLRLPAVYFQPEFVQDGGLISYSANVEEMFRRAAGYVDKILKGAKAADLPIERPSRFELSINLMTARSIGLTIPDALLVRADTLVK